MFAVLSALAGMGLLLLSAEVLWHRKILSGEYARKYVHILGGSFVAFWPYFLSFTTIRVIALAGILVWLVTRSLHVSYALRDINRPTVGELLYPVGVFFVALLAHDKWIFTSSILFVSLADGMAAIVGKRYGTKKLTYKVYGGKKTIQGSAAYLVCAYLALLVGLLLGGRHALTHSPILVFGWLPLVCTFLENLSPYGSDNFTVPLLVVGMLNFVLSVSLL